MSAPPSVVSVRSRIQSIHEPVGAATRRSIVILAIDGVPHSLAQALWPRAKVSRLTSVLPTTSPTAWLSSVTGLTVDAHGVPGVVFRMSTNEPPIHVLEFQGELGCPEVGTIFSDGSSAGYNPVAVIGDFESCVCSWRNELTKGAKILNGFRFFTDDPPISAKAMGSRISRIAHEIRRSTSEPALIWILVDADLHVHSNGYDTVVVSFLESIDNVATELVGDGFAVVAYSDHGLTRTSHNIALASALAELQQQYGFELGGAGRTRWLYPRLGTTNDLAAELVSVLPRNIAVLPRDSWFTPGSLAATRVGEIVIVAQGEEFMTFGGHIFDHGSASHAELYVPFAVWRD